MADIKEAEQSEVEAFWTRARNRAKVYPLEAVIGQDAVASLCPPTWAFGATAEQANELVGFVMDGRKRATSSWKPSYEAAGEAIPEVGELSIVCDGDGIAQVLLRTTEVRVVPFGDVGEDVALAEGEGKGDGTDLEQWRSDHELFFREECASLGIDFDPDGEVIVEFFEPVYTREIQ